MSTLVAENLKKRYGKRTVVKDVSISVSTGEVVGLLGPNGAGKTTCFYMIVGLVGADAGSIVLRSDEAVGKNSNKNEDLFSLPMHERARRGVGYLPQEASVFRKLSVADNIRAVLELQHDAQGKSLKRAAIDAGVDALLEDLQITHIRDSIAASLSGGERRRVEIARTLASKPKFVLLDEPFAGVDPIAVIEIQRIVRFLKSRGIGVLITDHNVRETLGIVDRAYIIAEGEVLAQGLPEDVVQNEVVRRVYLGEHFKM